MLRKSFIQPFYLASKHTRKLSPIQFRLQNTPSVLSLRAFTTEEKKVKNENGENPNKFSSIVSTVSSIGSNIFSMIQSPQLIVAKSKYFWQMTKETASHYWIGTKLLWSELKTATYILKRILQGHGMTRRERLQLIRTAGDIFRLVPFLIFVIVPFMEFLLPFALKLFPNMLPSTYQDSLKKEELMKNELTMRIAVAGFMQETLQNMAKKKNTKATNMEDISSSAEIVEFMEKAKNGESLHKDTILRMARLFKDELTLANVPRPQLASMCQFMSIKPYGSDAFLRFQLRSKLKAIKEDDRRILWEGFDSLTLQELREACQERGMRATGLSKFGYQSQLEDWIELSMQKNIPISLLIMSRSFSLNNSRALNLEAEAEESLRNSISSLDEDVLNEVILEHAHPTELDTAEMRERKFDSIQFQNEMILEEREDSEEAKIANMLHSDEISKDLVGSRLTDRNENHSEIDTQPLLQEVQALADMATKSSVEREKIAVAMLKASIEPPKVTDLLHESVPFIERAAEVQESELNVSMEGFPPVPPKEDHLTAALVVQDHDDDIHLNRMRRALGSMIRKLEDRIVVTDKELGSKLHRLDRDADGLLDSEELRNAVASVLKRYSNPEEVNKLVQILDKDQDGKVSVDELKQYIEEIRASVDDNNVKGLAIVKSDRTEVE